MKCKSKSGTNPGRKDPEMKLPRKYPWAVLQALTEDLRQYLTPEENGRLQTILRERNVEKLLLLGKEWGLQCIPPSTGNFDLQNFKAKYQLAALLKKYSFPGNRKMQEARALEKFLAAEELCRSFNLEGWKELANCSEEWEVNAVTYAKAFLQKLLGVQLPEFEELTERSRHGPGASLDTEPGLVSSYFKYSNWPYQCTSAVYRYAKDAIRNDDRWLGALEDDYRTRYNIPKHVLLDRKTFWHTVLEIVPGARIAFVPKNAEIFRTITIEPTMNVFLQLGVDGYIRRRLKRWGVDLDSQEKNQKLARIGSMGGEDPPVTVDLASASDTVSLKACEFLLPDEWNSYLLDLRSPMCDLKGDVFWLQKMSAMGNGFTFVLESAIFTSLIYGVMMATNGRFDRDDFAVFGDDLVCRRSLVHRLIRLLTLCGFAINSEKSFIQGPVRESCGCDWFEGIPVRPVFLDDAPTNVKELLSARNRLKRILYLRWGLEESKTVELMDKWIPEKYRTCIGPLSDTDFDSHVHSATKPYKGVWLSGKVSRRDTWEYKSIVYHARRCRADSFLFRKLMHDCRPVQNEPFSKARKLAGKGSRFTVSVRNHETVGIQRSAAWNWQVEYAEALPAVL